MSAPSLARLDAGLRPVQTLRDGISRVLFLGVLALLFLGMLLSGGVNRFLSDTWVVTAVLRVGVPEEEGAGIAAKVDGLPTVRSAAYRTPEEAWEEFVALYPGLRSLRSEGGNPLPGYIEIRMLPSELSEETIREVESSLRDLPQVEKVLAGGEGMPRLMRIKGWVNGVLWGGLALLGVAFLLLLLAQERARAGLLARDLEYLTERGVSGRRIRVLRAAVAAAAGALFSLVGLGLAVLLLLGLLHRFPSLGSFLASPGTLLSPGTALRAAAFPAGGALLSFLASLAGARSARTRGE